MPSSRLDIRATTLRRRIAEHPFAFAALLYGVLAMIFAGQGLLPGRTLSGSDLLWFTAPWQSTAPAGLHPGGANYELADAVAVFQPFFEHTRAVLPHMPLWNTHIAGGRPYLANAQSAVFSPFTLPMYVLPFWKALAVVAILKLWIGALGAYALGRGLGMRFGGAFVAGLVFAFGTFFVSWLAWPLTNIFPLIPWLLLATDRIVRDPGRVAGATLALLTGLQLLGGHPETSFHLVVATVVFFAFRAGLAWRQEGREPRSLLRPALVFGLSLAGGIALAALVLVPIAELFLHSADYAMRAQKTPSHSEPRFLGAFFLSDYWGRPTQTEIEPIVSNRGYYAGGITLMLASAALVLRPTAERIGVAVFGAIALAVAVGAQPIFRAVTAFPGFKAAHNGRLVVYVLLALALLAGWGADELTGCERPSRVRRKAALALAGAILCIPVAWMVVAGTLHPGRLGPALRVAWGFEHPPLVRAGLPIDPTLKATIRLSALLQWLPLAGAGLLLVAARLTAVRMRGRVLTVTAFVALAALVLVADLFRANMGMNPAIPISHARQPTTTAIRYLQKQRPNRFTGFDRATGQPLQADLAMRYGLYDARGYDYPVEERYNDLWRHGIGPPGDFRPPITGAVATAASLRGLSLLSVKDIMQDPSDPPSHLPGLHLAYSGQDARIYENRNALPRAFVVTQQRTVNSKSAALAAVTDAGADLRRTAVSEGVIPGLPLAHTRGGPSAGRARIVSYGDEHATVRTDTTKKGLLILTDVEYPGWKVTVDGRSEPIHRVDFLLRGVAVNAGVHRVEFRYEPASFRAGWIVSLLALLVTMLIGFAGLRARRSRGEPS